MKIGDQCVPISTFASIAAVVGVLVACQIAYSYLAYRRRKNDEVWNVKPEELELSYPVEVIGQGAFGVVLAAEYRGTRVAIKRVISQDASKRRATSSLPIALSNSVAMAGSPSASVSNDIESPETGPSTRFVGSVSNSRDTLGDSNMSDIFGGFSAGRKKSILHKWFPGWFTSEISRTNLFLLGSASGASTSKSTLARILPRCDETARREEDFKNEMRLLSRLRHPCKYLITFAFLGHILCFLL